METRCIYTGAVRTMDGDISVSFIVEDEAQTELEALKGKELVMDVNTYKKKRSLSANAYFWKLCDEIAKRLGSDKETIYLMKLKDVGIFEMIDVPSAEAEKIGSLFRYYEIDHTFSAYIEETDRVIEMASLHCYKGSHEYDSAQMSRLINMISEDAQALGICTWTPDEIEHTCSLWRAR